MSLHKLYATNETKEVEGVDIPFPDAVNSDGTIPTFRIVRMGVRNVNFSKAQAKYTKPYRRLIESDRLPVTKRQEINIKVFIEAALTGWSNVKELESIFPEYGNGEVPYNFDNALKLFGKLSDLFFDLQAKSLSADTFKDDESGEDTEGDTKNS